MEDENLVPDNIIIDYVGDEQTYYYLDTELEQKDYTYRIYSVDDNENISEDYAEVERSNVILEKNVRDLQKQLNQAHKRIATLVDQNTRKNVSK